MSSVQKIHKPFSTKAKQELAPGREINQNGLVYRKRKDGTGTWRYDFQDGGKRYKGSIGAEKDGVTLSQARETLKAIKAKTISDRISGKVGRSTQSEQKFTDAAMAYLDWSSEHHQDTRHNKGRMEKHLLPRFGHMKLGEIRTSHVEAMRTALYQAGLKRSTVQRIVCLLSGVFEHARKSDDHLPNPTRNLSRMKSQSEEVTPFSEPETTAMLETGCLMYNTVSRGPLKGSRSLNSRRTAEARAMVGLALYAGLRASEVLGLEWRDVDLETRNLKIHQTAHDGELRPTTKNYKVRTVPIGPSLMPILVALKSESERRDQATGLLFSRDGVHPYHQVQNIFGRIKRQAGINVKGGFHALRHTFATRFANRGGAIPRLQKLLGHSDIKVTMGYAHVTQDDLDKARNFME